VSRQAQREFGQVEAVEAVDACGERRERRQPGEVPVHLIEYGPLRSVERQRSSDFGDRAPLGRNLELQRGTIAIHGGRNRDAVVAGTAGFEHETVDAQIEVSRVFSGGSFRLQSHRDRLGGDVPEAGVLDVELGRLGDCGIPSSEALDVPTRSNRDGHSIQRVAGRGGWEERAKGSQAARRRAQREVDCVARFRRVEGGARLADVDRAVEDAATCVGVIDVRRCVSHLRLDSGRGVHEKPPVAPGHAKTGHGRLQLDGVRSVPSRGAVSSKGDAVEDRTLSTGVQIERCELQRKGDIPSGGQRLVRLGVEVP